MIVRAIDSDGDWTFGKGKNNYRRGRDAQAQTVQSTVRCFLADCFWDLAKGIDWWNLLGSKNPLLLDYSLQTSIVNIPFVTGLKKRSLTLNPITRAERPIYDIDLAADEVEDVVTPFSISTTRLLTELGDVLTTESGDPIGL